MQTLYNRCPPFSRSSSSNRISTTTPHGGDGSLNLNQKLQQPLRHVILLAMAEQTRTGVIFFKMVDASHSAEIPTHHIGRQQRPAWRILSQQWNIIIISWLPEVIYNWFITYHRSDAYDKYCTRDLIDKSSSLIKIKLLIIHEIWSTMKPFHPLLHPTPR